MLPVPGASWKVPRMICGLNQWIVCLLDYPSTKCNSNPLPELDKLGIDSSSSYCVSWKPRFCLTLVHKRGAKGPSAIQGLELLTIAFLSISSLQPGEWNDKHSTEILSVRADLTETGTVSTDAGAGVTAREQTQGIMRKHHSQGHTTVWLTKKCQFLAEMWLCAASQAGSRESTTLQLLVG